MQAAFLEALPSSDWVSASSGLVVAFVRADDWVHWSAEAASLLDDAELGRIRRRRRHMDRHMLTIGYAMHRLLVGTVLGQHPRDVSLYRDSNGAPGVAGARIWTSLGHADGCVALAVNVAGTVGIDLEPSTRSAAAVEVAAEIGDPDELGALPGQPGSPRRATALLERWVQKEALLKAAGVGLAVDMRSAPVRNRMAAISGRSYYVQPLDAGPAWVAALATRRPAMPAVCWLVPHLRRGLIAN